MEQFHCWIEFGLAANPTKAEGYTIRALVLVTLHPKNEVRL